jgi:DNA-binding transcriptional LysR family regulator
LWITSVKSDYKGDDAPPSVANMDIRQLSALLAVADHGSFSAAARTLHTVQSNISTRISRLETELGTQLIDRDTRTLTPEGVVVAARARRIQAEVNSIQPDLTALSEHVLGQVRLGIIGSTARWLTRVLLEAVHETHPLVNLRISEAVTTALVPMVVAGGLDAAVTSFPCVDPDVIAEELFEEDIVLVVPEGHPLARHEQLAPEDLAQTPILLAPTGTTLRDEIDAELAAHGVVLTALAEAEGPRLLASLAFDGYGPALVPASAASWPGANRIPVSGLARRSVGLIWNRRVHPSAPTRAACDVLRVLVAEHASDEQGIHPVGSA